MLHGGICFITDRRFQELSLEETVRIVLDAGIRWIQYREKYLPRREIFREAEKLKRLAESYDAFLIINDHADIALAVDAGGVHLGQDDLPLEDARQLMGERTIGISTHDLNQALEAERGGADYIGFGPIFSTTTKENPDPPRGPALLSRVSGTVKIPVVAIGGITLDNLRTVLDHGASAVAVASGILRSGDIYAASREFVRIIREKEA
jgi:thiamine-phosphate pyrophosphorylase